MRCYWNDIKTEAVRFLLVGGVNTLATLIVYWVLLPLLGYGPAYTAAFLAGIAISYLLNVRFVFKVRATPRSAMIFPVVYIVQYCVGLGVLWAWSDYLRLPPSYGVVVSITVTIPITFLLAKLVLKSD